MQELEHQKQALWAMHGAIAERTQSHLITFIEDFLCGDNGLTGEKRRNQRSAVFTDDRAG
jgi:hypothetical protein